MRAPPSAPTSHCLSCTGEPPAWSAGVRPQCPRIDQAGKQGRPVSGKVTGSLFRMSPVAPELCQAGSVLCPGGAHRHCWPFMAATWPPHGHRPTVQRVAGAAQGAGLPDHKGMGWRQAGGVPGRPLRRPPKELGALAPARQGTPTRGPLILQELQAARLQHSPHLPAARPLACLHAPARVGTAEPGRGLHPSLACGARRP